MRMDNGIFMMCRDLEGCHGVSLSLSARGWKRTAKPFNDTTCPICHVQTSIPHVHGTCLETHLSSRLEGDVSYCNVCVCVCLSVCLCVFAFIYFRFKNVFPCNRLSDRCETLNIQGTPSPWRTFYCWADSDVTSHMVWQPCWIEEKKNWPFSPKLLDENKKLKLHTS